jgi:glycosyltransferase involved in cell wall biosynthesis
MLCSTLEGFGMPIIEAQAMGRVVITSNVSSMPDVAGKGALLVDPLNINAMQSALEKILSDESLRKQLIEYGFENIKRFDATTVSEMYLELYQSLLQAHA